MKQSSQRDWFYRSCCKALPGRVPAEKSSIVLAHYRSSILSVGTILMQQRSGTNVADRGFRSAPLTPYSRSYAFEIS